MKILGHALGQRGHEHAGAFRDGRAAFREQIIDLALHRPHVRHRVDQAGRPDDLLGEHARRALHLPGPRRRADEHGQRPEPLPLLELERAVVDAGRKPEAELGQDGFPRVVAALHAADLRHRDVALVHDQQRVLGQVFEQRRRRIARPAARQIPGIVLDAFAGAGRLHHLDVERRALLQAFGFEQFSFRRELLQAFLQLDLDVADRLAECRARRYVMAVGVDRDPVQLFGLLAGQRIELLDRFDLVAEQHHAPGAVLVVARMNVDRLAAHPKRAALKRGVVAAVLQFDQRFRQPVALDPAARLQLDDHLGVGLDRADAVDARDGRDEHDVVPFQQRLRRGMAHAVDLLVDLRVLLDIRVGARHVCFRLVVVVVADEILDRVVREEALHLAVELGGERLVRRQDQRRLLHRLDHLRHRERLARPGDAEQHLVALALPHACRQLADRRRLVAAGVVFRHDGEPLAAGPRGLLLGHEQDRGRAKQGLGHGREMEPGRGGVERCQAVERRQAAPASRSDAEVWA